MLATTRESTVPILITDLGNQHIILGEPWINKHKVLLDIVDNRIIFVLGRCDHIGTPTPKPPTSSLGVRAKSTASKSARPTKIALAKPRPRKVSTPRPTPPPPEEDKALDISQIGAAAFHLLAQNPKKYQVQCFSVTLAGTERELGRDVPTEAIRETTVHTREDIKKKLPKEYYDLIDVFDKDKAKELPPYRLYDHKIELELGKRLP